MKRWFRTSQFFVACAMLFGSGYFFASPRNHADPLFAPTMSGMAVYFLWRRTKSNEFPFLD
jgi:hypothetical protein